MNEKYVEFGNCIGLANLNYKKGVLFYSGFFGDKDESHDLFKNFIPLLHKNKFSTLRFDFTGLGENKNNLDNIVYSNWKKDSLDALEFFKKSVNEIYVVGFSLGATYAINPIFKKLALWAPAFDPKKDMLERYKQNGDYELAKNNKLYKSEKFVSKKMLDSLNFNMYKELEKISNPILICHSENDPYIPLNPISNKYQLYISKNTGHSFRSDSKNSRKIIYKKTLKFFNKN